MTGLAGESRPTERSLRILMVSARFAPFVGGTEIHTGQVAKELVSRGHRVTVLTTDLQGSLPATEEVDGVEVVRLRAYPRWSDLYFAPKIRSWIPRREWDLVHVQGYHTAVAPMALRVAQNAGIPTVVTFHSGGHSSRFRNLIRPLQIAVLRRYLLRSAGLIGVSSFEADLFSRRMGIDADRIEIIPNGVDRPTPPPGQRAVEPGSLDQGDHDLNNDHSPDDLIILSAGRLVRYKGHHRIIAAIPKILDVEPRARLLILGKGPYEKNLRSLVDRLGIADRVTFDSVPAHHRHRMDRLMESASVAVVLSDYESHGMVAHEALDAGLPLVVLDRSALGELAASGAARAVPPRASRQEVAEIVLRCLAETDGLPAARNGDQKVVRKRATWANITDRVEKLYLDSVDLGRATTGSQANPDQA